MSLGRFPLSNSCSRQHSKLTFKLFTVFAKAVGEDGTRGRERGREGKRERQKKRERVRERENESERERWDQFVVAEAVGEDRAAGREGRREGGWERQKDRDPQYHLVFNETPSRRILQYRKRKKTSSSLPRRWARTAREGGGKAKQRDRAREREREREGEGERGRHTETLIGANTAKTTDGQKEDQFVVAEAVGEDSADILAHAPHVCSHKLHLQFKSM